MPDIRKHSSTSNLVRFVLKNSSTGQGLTGLTSASSGLIISTVCDNEATATIYTVAATNVETITTLGTFAAPTASKCRFKEVDATNHKGLYEFQFADARFAIASARRLVVSVTGAANLLDTDYEIQLVAVDIHDTVRMGLTALPNAAADAAGGLPISDAGGLDIDKGFSSIPRIWHVDNVTDGAGDLGTREAPFDTYAAAESAAVAGDIIHLKGTATTYGNITIAKQITLIGDGSGVPVGEAAAEREAGTTLVGIITISSSNVTIKNLICGDIINSGGFQGIALNQVRGFGGSDCLVMINGATLVAKDCIFTGGGDAILCTDALSIDLENTWVQIDCTTDQNVNCVLQSASGVKSFRARHCTFIANRSTANNTRHTTCFNGAGNYSFDDCTLSTTTSHATHTGPAYNFLSQSTWGATNVTMRGGSARTTKASGSGTNVEFDLNHATAYGSFIGADVDVSKFLGTRGTNYRFVDDDTDDLRSDWQDGGRLDLIVDSILVDTAEIGTAGAGLTNINLPNQTMDIVGNITGNLSGSVGSVTGAVDSVTGAVGSVTGNVGGNVVGSVGSIASGGIIVGAFASGAITEAAIAADAITNAKIAPNAIGPSEFANATITASKFDGTSAFAQTGDAFARIGALGVGLTAITDKTGLIPGATDVDGHSFVGALKLLLASLSKLSGAATTTNTFRDAADTKNRITATVDTDGNRTAVTFDST
jgi:hypothetical protein